MFDASSRSDAAAARLQRGAGAAELVVARRGGRTALARLYQRAPCRVLFPDPDPGEPLLAVMLTTSGGLTGGDDINWRIAVEPGAAATVTTQAAEKLYRSLGPDTTVAVELAVGAGASLEFLPQETILFDRSRLQRRTTVDVASSGSLLAAEMLVFGRAARGERFAGGRLYDGWRVRRGGRLVWADALGLDGDIAAALAAPFAFGGAGAVATALYVGDAAERLLPRARALAEGAATLVGGVLLARLLGSAQEVRARLVRYLVGLRAALGLAPRLPRLWLA